MRCRRCQALSASVNLATEQAHVERIKGATGAAALMAGDKAGYARAWWQRRPAAPAAAPSRDGWKLVAATLLSLPAGAAMLGDLAGRHWMLSPLVQWMLAGTGSASARASTAPAGALRAGSGNMDLLVALGTSAAFWPSQWLCRAHHGMPHLYFESAAVVITLVLLGKWLEARAKHQTTGRDPRLAVAAPETAARAPTASISMPVAEVAVGRSRRRAPRQSVFPADGRVERAAAMPTNRCSPAKSLPVAQPGDRITGGSLNAERAAAGRPQAIGAESTLARIVRLVESAQAARRPSSAWSTGQRGLRAGGGGHRAAPCWPGACRTTGPRRC